MTGGVSFPLEGLSHRRAWLSLENHDPLVPLLHSSLIPAGSLLIQQLMKGFHRIIQNYGAVRQR